MPRKESTVGVNSAQAQQEAILETEGIDSYELPRALITRIAKSALPDNVKLQKETVIALVKGATVFINYLAATSQDVTHSRSHKTIAASDVLTALNQLGFKEMIPKVSNDLLSYQINSKNAKSGGGASSKAVPPQAAQASSRTAYGATTVAPHETHAWPIDQGRSSDAVSFDEGYPEEDGEEFDDEEVDEPTPEDEDIEEAGMEAEPIGDDEDDDEMDQDE